MQGLNIFKVFCNKNLPFGQVQNGIVMHHARPISLMHFIIPILQGRVSVTDLIGFASSDMLPSKTEGTFNFFLISFL